MSERRFKRYEVLRMIYRMKNWLYSYGGIIEVFLMAMGVAFLVVLGAKAFAESFDLDKMNVYVTGEERTIRWCNPVLQNSENWQTTIEVLEFPPKENQLPFEVWYVNAPADSQLWTPDTPGVFWMRARSCSDALSCSPWNISYRDQTGETNCVTDPTRFVIYIKLAPPSGGGVIQ